MSKAIVGSSSEKAKGVLTTRRSPARNRKAKPNRRTRPQTAPNNKKEQPGRGEQPRAMSDALSAERQRFIDVLNMLPAYVILLSQDYRVPFANRFFEERFGKSKGKRCYEYLFERSEPCENCETFKVLKTHAPHEWEWTGPDARRYEIHDFPFTDADGSLMIMEMGIDITEIRKAQRALQEANERLEQRVAERTAELRESEQRLRLAQQGAEIGAFEWNIQTGVNIWTPELEAMYGLKPGEFAKTQPAWQGLVHPEDRPRALASVDRAIQSGRPVEAEWRIIWPDGSIHWIAGRFQVFLDANGKPLRLSGVNIDITKRKETEARMAADLDALTRMHELSGKPLQPGGLREMLQEIMDAAVAIMRADRGTLQLVEKDALRIEAHHGHQRPFLEFFANAENCASLCRQAMRRRTRVVEPDIERSSTLAGTPSLEVLRQAGVRAAQSTPIVSRTGVLLGILTTHWSLPHCADTHDFWRLDLLVRQAADLIEHSKAEEALQRRNAIVAGIGRIFHKALTCQTEEELGRVCLEVAEEVTQSKFGFIGELDENGLQDIAISDPGWEACQMPHPGGHGKRSAAFKIHGIYGRVLRDGNSLLTNDPAHHPDSIGLPKGHAPLKSFLGAPLLREGRTVGMIAVANREGGYAREQQELLEALTPAIVEAFLRKRAEEALRVSEEKFARAFASNPAAIVLTRLKDGLIMEVNETAEKMFGYKREDVVGKPSSELRVWPTPEARERYTEVLRRKGSLRDWEQTMLNGTGEPFVSLTSAEILTIAGEEMILSTWLDITERKRTEEALRESESFHRQILESIPGMVFTTRPNGFCDYQSQQWVDYTGVPVGEHLGDGWNKLLHPEDQPRAFAAWRAAVEGRAPYNLEYRVRRHDGAFEWFKVIGRPIRNQEGQIVRWFGVAANINELKRTEAELQQVQGQLRQHADQLEMTVQDRTATLQELVGDLEHFSYTLIHDMRAPLRTMRGFAEMMTEECAGCARQQPKSFLGRIMTSAERMDGLITDSLNFTKAVRQELPLEPVNVKALLAGMLDSYPELQPSKADIRIEGEFPRVMANEAGLTQCFSNLLGNAVKFVAAGQRPQVRVWAEQRDGRARVWFEDNGIGIPTEALGRLFHMFHRVHKQYEGTGIGLALVRKVAQRMSGNVGVESEEGKGSRFWIELRTFDDSFGDGGSR